VKRLAVVTLVVLVLGFSYRAFGSEETATGTLTLAAPEPNIGSTARNFVARDVEGNRFELADDGIYVLAFWSPLNQNSNKAREGFLRVAREYGQEASFAVVYVNGARTDVDAPYDRLYDPTGRLASYYNVKRVPRMFLVRDGVVSWVLDAGEYYEGYEDDLAREIEVAVEEEQEEGRQTAPRRD
jgi:hypothetical protein